MGFQVPIQGESIHWSLGSKIPMCFPWQNSCRKRRRKLECCCEKRCRGFMLLSGSLGADRPGHVHGSSLLGLSCVFSQLPCHMGSPVRVPPCLWDHQRWGSHLCGLRSTLAVVFIRFMNFHGGISWTSRSPKFEEMQNALAHLWRNAVSGIQTFAISLGR